MYSVLIVDDEEWVVESLKNGIAWKDFGFEVVDQAYDGAEALDWLFCTCPPEKHRPPCTTTT